MSKRFEPGQRVPDSGIYENVQSGDRVTVNRGDPFPPTPKAGQVYKPVHITDPSRRPGR